MVPSADRLILAGGCGSVALTCRHNFEIAAGLNLKSVCAEITTLARRFMSNSQPPSHESKPDAARAVEEEPHRGFFHRKPARSSHDEVRQPDRFDLAEMLKSRREALGWSLDEVAEITRVRRSYLEALEQAAYDVLPTRAFAIGFVKAYAKALGLDDEGLADMFRREVSPQSTKLHAPSGTSLEEVKPSYRRYLVAAGCLVAAIVAWNIWQRQAGSGHGGRAPDERLAAQSWKAGGPLIHDGVIYVTRPQAAPPDQDVPTPYVTPGLEAEFASINAAYVASSAAPADLANGDMRKAFNPRGAIYGAEPENSTVTIQATRSVNLVLRDPAGAIYFVHQFAPGEAYRLPDDVQQDVLLDSSDPMAFDMFYNGEYAGTMDTKVVPVGRVNARAAQLSSALDAHASATAPAQREAPPPPVVAPQAAPRSDAPIPYAPAERKPAPASSSAAQP